MTVITVEYFVIPGQMDRVLTALSEMKQKVEQDEPGCLGYQVLRAIDVENRLLLVETYRDAQALADHGETPHFKSILVDRVLPCLAHRQRSHFATEIDWVRQG